MVHISKKISKCLNNKHFEIIAILIYKIILDLIFLVFMKDYNIYYNSNFNIYKLLISIPLILVIYKIIQKVKEYIIRICLKTFYLFMFIPISTVYMGKNFSTFWYIIIFLELLLITLTVIGISSFTKKKMIKEYKSKLNINYEFTTKFIYYIFIINTVLTLILCIYYNGFPTLKALNFENVYEIREQFYLPKIINYLYTFETNFILQFLIIFYLHKKKYVKMTLIIAVQIIFYLLKADKILLLSIPLIIAIFMIFKYCKKIYIENGLPVFLGSLCLIGMILYNISNMFFAVFVTRLLIIPANLKFVFFDFFSKNPKIGIVGTVLNAILKYKDPYAQMPYPNLIAGQYFGDYKMYSNTGALVEGYARFGVIGIIIIPIIIGIVLSIINYGIKRNGIPFTIGIAIFPIMLLNDGYILPSAMFGGILLLMITCIFFDNNLIDKKEIKKLKNYN